MKPNHKCDPARMALLYIRQQFICTTFKFDAYVTLDELSTGNIEDVKIIYLADFLLKEEY